MDPKRKVLTTPFSKYKKYDLNKVEYLDFIQESF